MNLPKIWESQRRRPVFWSLVLLWTLDVGGWCLLHGATITEDFASNPVSHGWKVFGDTNLFQWQSAQQRVAVTWDSSRSNSYLYLPLQTIVNRDDDFSFALDLELTDVTAGIDPTKPSTFQLAFGLLNLVDATKTNFFRGNSALTPNLVEFDFFPDTGFGPTIWPSIWSTNSSLNYNGSGDYTLLDLPLGVTLRVTLAYTATNRILRTTITTNGVSIGGVHDVGLSVSFTDFRVATFAIESYSDGGQHPQYGGSLLAHGFIDNVQITVPPVPIGRLDGDFVNGHWRVTFVSYTNWTYTLERNLDLRSWTPVSADVRGNGTTLSLSDTNTVGSRSFYRVRGQR